MSPLTAYFLAGFGGMGLAILWITIANLVGLPPFTRGWVAGAITASSMAYGRHLYTRLNRVRG